MINPIQKPINVSNVGSRQLNWLENPVFLYGTGTIGREVHQLLISNGVDVPGFIDHRIIENSIFDLQVYLPDDKRISIDYREASSVVIAIHNRDARINTIVENLHRLGYGQIFTLVDLYDNFANELGRHYWLAPRNFYNAYEEEIRETQELFVDETSRDLFNNIIRFRRSGGYSLLPAPDLERQYFPQDIPAWKQPVRLVDCGAFDGDTLRNFIEYNILIETLAAFEPDENNFRKLSKYIQEKEIPNAFLWPCGVYSSSTQLKFASGYDEASVISDEGVATIQCVSLDEAIPNFSPTLIKMDIEGAEMEALHGAESIIRKYKPGLAISVYHTASHIWEIPLFIKRLTPDTYRYYLRAHAYNSFEVILYAIPI